MTVRLFYTPDEIGRHAAGHLLAGLRAAYAAQRDYIVGCPAVRTPRPVYAALAEALRHDPQDLSRLVLVIIDEYAVGDGDAPLRVADPAEHFSCRGFAEREIVGPINAVLPKHFRIRPHNVWFPDVETPASYDGRIDDAGGIDFFLMASGPHCLLMLWEQEKHEAFRRVTGPADFQADWPASIVWAAESREIFADHAAADRG